MISESESELKSKPSVEIGFAGGSFTIGIGSFSGIGLIFSGVSNPETPELMVELNELFAEPPLWELSRQSFKFNSSNNF